MGSIRKYSSALANADAEFPSSVMTPVEFFDDDLNGSAFSATFTILESDDGDGTAKMVLPVFLLADATFTIGATELTKGNWGETPGVDDVKINYRTGAVHFHATRIGASCDVEGTMRGVADTAHDKNKLQNEVVAVQTETLLKVTGPASAVDNRLARFDGTTGKLIQSSAVSVDDGGHMSGVGNLTASGNISATGSVSGSNLSGTNTGDVSLSAAADVLLSLTAQEIGFDVQSNLNRVLASPTSTPGVPTFRSLVNADLPAAISGKTITSSPISGSTGAFTTLSASGVLSVSNGSVGAPAIAASADPNTGLYFSTADTLRAVAGGSIRWEISATATKLCAADGNEAIIVSGSLSTSTGNVKIGDPNLEGNGTLLEIDDAAQSITTTGTLVVDDIDASGGELDGVTIGGSVPGDGTFTSLRLSFASSANTFESHVDGDFSQHIFAAHSGGASTHRPIIDFFRSRGTEASPTVVNSGDWIGSVLWRAHDGSSYGVVAEVSAEIDGTPGSGDLPSRLIFKTSADGSASRVERLRITNAGALQMPTLSTTPSDPAIGSLNRYVKGGKYVMQYNDGGTVKYHYIDLTATANQQFTYSATAP